VVRVGIGDGVTVLVGAGDGVGVGAGGAVVRAGVGEGVRDGDGDGGAVVGAANEADGDGEAVGVATARGLPGSPARTTTTPVPTTATAAVTARAIWKGRIELTPSTVAHRKAAILVNAEITRPVASRGQGWGQPAVSGDNVAAAVDIVWTAESFLPKFVKGVVPGGARGVQIALPPDRKHHS
jgi:hypothetical protein